MSVKTNTRTQIDELGEHIAGQQGHDELLLIAGQRLLSHSTSNIKREIHSLISQRGKPPSYHITKMPQISVIQIE